MANFMQCGDNYKIFIPCWKDVDKTTFYIIQIEIGDISWTVSRRYSEFAKLHQVLVADHGVTTDILPPKKIIGNRDEQFIEERRNSLEGYLCTVVRFLQKAMPRELSTFLNFHKFDVSFIVKNLAVKFYQSGEIILSKFKNYTFTPLEVFSINERLKQPCTSLDLLDQKEDFSHVLDFCCQLTELTMEGSDVPIPASNIVPNTLPLHFSAFKTLEHISLNNINCAFITDLGSLRYTLKNITVNKCTFKSFVELFLCDKIHKSDLSHQNEWKNVLNVGISNTSVTTIDQSVRLLPNLTFFSLDNNQISEISNLDCLPSLSHLTLKKNRLNKLETIVAKKLVLLDLSENQIETLEPFSKLDALETLNVQMNKINAVDEVRHISDLPSLENLVLTGNPVSQIVDYRVKVLEHFGSRAFRICLDNESTNQKELDKVAILKALHSTKHGMVSGDTPP